MLPTLSRPIRLHLCVRVLEDEGRIRNRCWRHDTVAEQHPTTTHLNGCCPTRKARIMAADASNKSACSSSSTNWTGRTRRAILPACLTKEEEQATRRLTQAGLDTHLPGFGLMLGPRGACAGIANDEE